MREYLREAMLTLERWEFPKIRGTILGVPIIRTVAFGSLYWGSPILENNHIKTSYSRPISNLVPPR